MKIRVKDRDCCEEAHKEIRSLTARLETLRQRNTEERLEFLQHIELTKRMYEAEVEYLRGELARAYEGGQ